MANGFGVFNSLIPAAMSTHATPIMAGFLVGHG
jgi:hypothetical protein